MLASVETHFFYPFVGQPEDPLFCGPSLPTFSLVRQSAQDYLTLFFESPTLHVHCSTLLRTRML